MKICGTCKEEKDLCDFNKNHTKKDGLSSLCRNCSKARSKQYYKENKDKHIKEVVKNNKKYLLAIKEKIRNYKIENGGCLICKEIEPCCLDFHHLDRNKKINNISKLVKYYNWTAILLEIKKCIILCSNCHRKLHNGIITLPCQFTTF